MSFGGIGSTPPRRSEDIELRPLNEPPKVEQDSGVVDLVEDLYEKAFKQDKEVYVIQDQQGRFIDGGECGTFKYIIAKISAWLTPGIKMIDDKDDADTALVVWQRHVKPEGSPPSNRELKKREALDQKLHKAYSDAFVEEKNMYAIYEGGRLVDAGRAGIFSGRFKKINADVNQIVLTGDEANRALSTWRQERYPEGLPDKAQRMLMGLDP